MRYNIKIGEYEFNGEVDAQTTLQAVVMTLNLMDIRVPSLLKQNGRYQGTTLQGHNVEVEVW